MRALLRSLFSPAEPRGYLRLALGYYLLATSLGLLLRLAFVSPLLAWLPFGNALHAHSHTLYFGWVGLALFALAFERLGAPGAPLARADRAALTLIHLVSLATFVAFLHSGYGRPGVIVSASSLFVWLYAAARLALRLRGRTGVAYGFLRGALAYLVLAMLGAVGRVVLLAAHVKDAHLGQLAVFAFLHCFAGFFVLGLMGLLVLHAAELGVRFEEAPLRRLLRWKVLLAWLTFPLGVPGGSSGALGWAARAAALALAYPGFLWVRTLWRASRSTQGSLRGLLRWVALWALLEGGMEAAGALGLSEWATRLHHPAILYLHVLLLGVVTGGLLLPLLLQLGRRPGALHLHHAGLALMAAGLALTGAGMQGLLGFGTQLLRAGLVLAAAGGAGVVLAGFALALPWARGRAVAVSPPEGQEPPSPRAEFA
ncbi:hypothetical protein FGE12_25220 [Aggregicoccus sp. 17bor-14]|uniref:hypothetical protein n=1 Tax=Myxococcaceae TaxID=31 RepID=UPI00129CEF0A|nr:MULTISPECIES: hypothetical protein [Myxococcaceae]MBF5045733.1 hypothetical protein [Simulacricoccus sp. 17bor-14]MRI91469.1 hypothetical protein [Aggregicoccus sp. 17bor-14]